MQAASGLVTVLNLVLSLVVGVRLLRGSRGWNAPERHLAAYFLLSSFVGAILMVLAYGSLVDPNLEALVAHRATLLGWAILFMHLGVSGVYLFTWRTFRSDRAWARLLASLGIACMFVGFAIEAVFEGFEIRVLVGPGHWIGWAGRTAVFVWAAVEAFHYYGQMRRRVRLGLADPVLCNRFLLWGLWAVTGFFPLAADLIGRSTYLALAGTSEIVIEVLAPVLTWTIGATMISSIISGVTLFLTVFPTAGYQRWVASRAPGAQSVIAE